MWKIAPNNEAILGALEIKPEIKAFLAKVKLSKLFLLKHSLTYQKNDKMACLVLYFGFSEHKFV